MLARTRNVELHKTISSAHRKYSAPFISENFSRPSLSIDELKRLIREDIFNTYPSLAGSVSCTINFLQYELKPVGKRDRFTAGGFKAINYAYRQELTRLLHYDVQVDFFELPTFSLDVHHFLTRMLEFRFGFDEILTDMKELDNEPQEFYPGIRPSRQLYLAVKKYLNPQPPEDNELVLLNKPNLNVTSRDRIAELFQYLHDHALEWVQILFGKSDIELPEDIQLRFEQNKEGVFIMYDHVLILPKKELLVTFQDSQVSPLLVSSQTIQSAKEIIDRYCGKNPQTDLQPPSFEKLYKLLLRMPDELPTQEEVLTALITLGTSGRRYFDEVQVMAFDLGHLQLVKQIAQMKQIGIPV